MDFSNEHFYLSLAWRHIVQLFHLKAIWVSSPLGPLIWYIYLFLLVFHFLIHLCFLEYVKCSHGSTIRIIWKVVSFPTTSFILFISLISFYFILLMFLYAQMSRYMYIFQISLSYTKSLLSIVLFFSNLAIYSGEHLLAHYLTHSSYSCIVLHCVTAP